MGTGKIASGTIRRVPRLLVLDDDDACRRAGVRWFARAHFDVVGAASVPEALMALETRRFDALVSDMWLGDTSAAELLRALAERGIPLPPMVCISGDGDAARNPAWTFVAPTHRPLRFFDKPADFARVQVVLEAFVDRGPRRADTG
ncbi:MAG: response regulator [Myxococcota bacterium]